MPQSTFHAIFRVASKNGIPDTVLQATRCLLPVFKQQPGFQGSTLLRSHDATQLINHLRWDTQADHEVCRASPDFVAVSDEWGVIFKAGKVEVQTYDVLAETPAPAKTRKCKRNPTP